MDRNLNIGHKTARAENIGHNKRLKGRQRSEKDKNKAQVTKHG